MPTVKPPYDRNGSWKNRKYSVEDWDKLQVRIQEELRQFYPDEKTANQIGICLPLDEWSNYLLHTAKSAVSTMKSFRLRLTNEELKAEQRDLLKTLKAASSKLDRLSFDFQILLAPNADPRGCMDKIKKLIPHVEAAEQRIHELPRATRRRVADHEAAVEMAIRVLSYAKETGVPIAATGQLDVVEFSPAVKILKILGDALHLRLEEITWRGVIISAKKQCPDLSS